MSHYTYMCTYTYMCNDSSESLIDTHYIMTQMSQWLSWVIDSSESLLRMLSHSSESLGAVCRYIEWLSIRSIYSAVCRYTYITMYLHTALYRLRSLCVAACCSVLQLQYMNVIHIYNDVPTHRIVSMNDSDECLSIRSLYNDVPTHRT